ncbi:MULTISPECIES: hypothetical protein [unclassified Oceanobacter]|jgi:hypothetical protein|uniref:hypothetical protein n=1 Tax=unclassified Oceanobacter TaxID=2620260 RepID=UPI0026E38D3B|nr:MULTISPECIES: hypothetical protein [unclassified Oceanobacter]MDO6683469.1 hypothetical protein [Oceanobacter sp. 5_MG-2023]MDP2507288.1 hypothetical protein [Oceanobacter sp. 3_MG-2023]MDP2548433.1 hypothetical protein [Oceanobacter sp. 4_MG-2023]
MKSPLGLDADLPVMDIVQESLGLLWVKRGIVSARFLPVMLLLAGLDWVSSTWMSESHLFGQLGFMLVSMLLGVVFATACHRMTLMPEKSLVQKGIWRREEWRYLMRLMLMGLATSVVITPIVILFALLQVQQMMVLGGALAIMTGLYVSARLAITLPEIAVGQTTSFQRAWKLSKGNGSRLVMVVWIAPLLISGPFLLLFLLDNTLLNYLAAFGSYVTSLISLVMMSLSYRFLTSFESGNDHPVVSSSSDGFDA